MIFVTAEIAVVAVEAIFFAGLRRLPRNDLLDFGIARFEADWMDGFSAVVPELVQRTNKPWYSYGYLLPTAWMSGKRPAAAQTFEVIA